MAPDHWGHFIMPTGLPTPRPQLRVQTESVKTPPVITTIYTSRYQVLCHRCERETSMIGVFSTVTMAWGIKYDITIVQ